MSETPYADAVCRASAIALTGLHGTAVTVEAAVSQQLPGMTIIGLPDTALAEAKLRVRSATTQAGFPLSKRFLTVNLSPAALPKHGAGFDLAIALAALAASRRLPAAKLLETAHLGELALGGELRRPAGLLSSVVAARQLGFVRVMVPAECASEAQLVPGIEIVAVGSLADAVGWYRHGANGIAAPPILSPDAPAQPQGNAGPDLSEIIGQPEAVEALAVVAAGRHHLSLLGPPGAGKTLLATRLPTILPALTDTEALEATSIASLGGNPLTGLIRHPPFESPHHTATTVAIIGGGAGSVVRPGAVTRAHHGVLFLDELGNGKCTS
ncbi:MG(2+) CHELATASE FAMILY PROTEIN / ComM-related protein [Leucobacter sp. 7(1)]|uniref:ATP-binding protein n=1 Tax=Leucobacter sp. 7(1) TaxID=1255613 RepID=UPI00097F1038|nr:ATP-binding protein [Leucobacter sp. 7(1)]SJN08629.1 MG(2+) CHELATASE FAMILY PROTEIN / ComM-related protein [Leucobacter sp. 7(1)]